MLNVSEPWVGLATLAAVRPSNPPVSGSESLTSTPAGPATVNVVAWFMLYVSATGTGAALLALTVMLAVAAAVVIDPSLAL